MRVCRAADNPCEWFRVVPAEVTPSDATKDDAPPPPRTLNVTTTIVRLTSFDT